MTNVKDAFKFCPMCAARLESRSTSGLHRQTCPECAYIHWHNPIVGVAVIVQEGNKILLGRRSRGKYRGMWCIPCGYLEYDEEVREGAAREFREETGLTVEILDLYTVLSNFHNPQQHTVGIWFQGKIMSGEITPGDDLDQVGWFSLNELPGSLAFPTDRRVIDQLREEHHPA